MDSTCGAHSARDFATYQGLYRENIHDTVRSFERQGQTHPILGFERPNGWTSTVGEISYLRNRGVKDAMAFAFSPDRSVAEDLRGLLDSGRGAVICVSSSRLWDRAGRLDGTDHAVLAYATVWSDTPQPRLMGFVINDTALRNGRAMFVSREHMEYAMGVAPRPAVTIPANFWRDFS
ncbi:MAG: hypothetical protein RL689_734 [Planctomycetota bacterium]